LDLLRDQHKPAKPPLELEVHETRLVDNRYKRLLVSYQVEEDDIAHTNFLRRFRASRTRVEITLGTEHMDAIAPDLFVIGTQQEVNLLPVATEHCPVVTAHGTATDDGNFHGGNEIPKSRDLQFWVFG
jgi:hypothetical protein